MRIPERFKLFGQTIEVTHDPSKFVEEKEGTYGYASYRENKIYLKAAPHISKEMQEQVFLHELMHFILYHSEGSYKESKDSYMHSNEWFVDLCSQLLHQALTTMEYPPEELSMTFKAGITKEYYVSH